jgi:hypothetical protein
VRRLACVSPFVLAFLLFALPACATEQSATNAPAPSATPAANKWELVSCQLNNMGCRAEGLFATSGACEKAKEIYRKAHPARTAGCMKKP